MGNPPERQRCRSSSRPLIWSARSRPALRLYEDEISSVAVGYGEADLVRFPERQALR